MLSRYAPMAIVAAAAMVLLAGCAGPSESQGGDDVTLQFESWRPEDAAVWTDTILPAFHKEHPNITVEFTPTNATEYDAALRSRFEGGTAGDLITCRSGAINRANITNGYLDPLESLAGLDNFDDLSLSYFGSAEGDPYCVPAASVMAGFFYNKEIFKELGLSVPETRDEFHDVLDEIKDDGRYTPLAYGSADSWIVTFLGFYNVGPNYWKGEEGRQGVIDGTQKVTDTGFVDGLTELASWTSYMPDGQASVTYADATQLFALGKAAIFPSGSWDINAVTANGLDIGVFAPPVPESGDQLYVQSHPDMGIGINAASKHKNEAKAFLEWVASSEFGTLYANELPGFFGMSKEVVSLENPLAQEWSDLKSGAELTPRIGQFELSGGNPNWETDARRMVPLLMSGELSPTELAEGLQSNLEKWYAPQQG